MSKPSALIAVALVSLVAAVALFWPQADNESATAERAQKIVQAPPAQQLEGVVLEGVDDKGGHWKVRAETAQADAEGAVGVLCDVTFDLFSDSEPLTATAKKCAIDADSSLELLGGAQISWDKWHAQMQRALYDMTTQSVRAESGVTVTGETLRVSSQTMEIDLANSVATMGGGVKAVFEGKTK